VAWAILAGLLVWALPLFLCMPLWVDCVFYDLGVRSLLRHGVLYQKVFYHGAPGIFWLQAAVRSLVGWGSGALRWVDLLLVAGSLLLLVNWPPAGGRSRAARIGMATVFLFVYFSTSEWCHCQPDTWMLLPALTALYLRQRQLADLRSPEARIGRAFILRGLAEGLCWGAAFLIKPFIAAPALACLLLGLALSRAPGRRMLLDLGLVLAGGLLAGTATLGWLWFSGDWPAFLDVARGDWRADYLANAPDWRTRSARALLWLLPWSAIHLLALPLALILIGRAVTARLRGEMTAGERTAPALLAACYLGWFVQANLLQMQFLYHLVAPLLLGLALLAGHFWSVSGWVRWPLLTGLLLTAVVPHPHFTFDGEWVVQEHPLLQRERLSQWGRCWREGSSPAVRDRLTLESQYVAPSWMDLHRVAQELRRRGVRDRELTCFSLSTLSLYDELGVEPSTRFAELWACLMLFPAHRAEIIQEVRSSPQRYVVSDLCDLGLTPEQTQGSVQLNPQLARSFPWAEPVVFRSGRYLLHRVRRPEEVPSASDGGRP
jgi:hypothetical protein